MDKIKELFIKYKEIIMYVFVGGLTTVVSFLTQFLAHLIGADMSVFDGGITLSAINAVMESPYVSPMLASTISWICTVTFAFFANRLWVFESKAKGKSFLWEFFSFYAARLTSYGIELLMMWVFVSVMGINEMLIKLIAQIIILVMNYVLSKLVVFRKKKTENQEATE